MPLFAGGKLRERRGGFMKKRRLVFALACLNALTSCNGALFDDGEYRAEVKAMVDPDWFIAYASHQAYLIFDFGYDESDRKFHRKADRDQLVYAALEAVSFHSYNKKTEEVWASDLEIDSGYRGDDAHCLLFISGDFSKAMITAAKGDLLSATSAFAYYSFDPSEGKAVYQAALTSQEKYPEDVDI